MGICIHSIIGNTKIVGCSKTSLQESNDPKVLQTMQSFLIHLRLWHANLFMQSKREFDPKIWVQDAVQKPFEAKQPEGRARLKSLLARIMIRAAKSDLVTIPPLFSKVLALQ